MLAWVAVAEYEKMSALPEGTIVRTIMSMGPDGAWARMERGEITPQQFSTVFRDEAEKQVIL